MWRRTLSASKKNNIFIGMEQNVNIDFWFSWKQTKTYNYIDDKHGPNNLFNDSINFMVVLTVLKRKKTHPESPSGTSRFKSSQTKESTVNKNKAIKKIEYKK